MNTDVYNYLVKGFDPQYTTRYVNDRKELQSVVKRIRKMTQSSPVYLLNFTNSKQSYVLGVKEASMKMNETLQILADDSEDSLFSKKKASSSDVEQVGVELVAGSEERLPSSFSLQVKQLANSQINVGREFYETGKGLPADSYQFKITVNDIGYDFQYNIRRDANHREVIQGLSSFITKAKIGIVAEPYYPSEDKIAMRLESTMVGTPNGAETFTLEDKNTDRGIIDYYGLNHVQRMPKSAVFDLNGSERTSMANEFTLARAVKVSLRKPSDTEAIIEYHPDADLIMDGVREFVDNYNRLVEYNKGFEKKANMSSKLQQELSGLMRTYTNELESNGISFTEEGYMAVDNTLALQSIDEGDMQKLFSKESPMVNRLYAKMDAVKINPMEYVDKKIVNYPNFKKPPQGYSYITSLYSGLIFNFYC